MTERLDIFKTQKAISDFLGIDLKNVYSIKLEMSGGEIPSVTVKKYVNITENTELQEQQFDLILKEKKE